MSFAKVVHEAMKILHVETGRQLLGGPQQVIYLMRGLIERGHDCTLVCPPGSGADTRARQNGIPVRSLFCAGDIDLPFAYRLSQYIRDSKPDLVHCHSRRGADVLGGLAASFADVPAVVSRRVDNTEMRVLAAIRYRPFEKIVAISEAVAAALTEVGVDKERIQVIRSAVDAAPFDRHYARADIDTAFGIQLDEFAIAAAGQLIARKGHRFLLDAVAALKETQSAFKLVIFGEGELEEELREHSTRLGLDDIVRFAGFREDLDSLLGCFDLLVHPALSEGLGIVTLKAAAAAVPVIGFKAGGLPEAVVDGETGLLVPAADVAALTGAMATLMNDDERRDRYGRAGQARMQAQFSIDAMVEQHLDLYRSVLDDLSPE
ncbi:MAG: glycosyltransferase family 4 protein [Pseudomonadota bacterium]